MMIPRRESGYDFAIRTPCTPARWNDFDTEMSLSWEVCHSFSLKLKSLLVLNLRIMQSEF